MAMTREQAEIVAQYKQYQAAAVEVKEVQLSQIRMQEMLRAAEINQRQQEIQELQRKVEAKKLVFLSEPNARDIEAIKNAMQSIYTFIDTFRYQESTMGPYYTSLKEILQQFENQLVNEVTNNPDPVWIDPIKTVKQLDETVRTVFNPIVSLETKENKIQEFKEDARNAWLSDDTKAGIAFCLGGVAVLAACFTPMFVFVLPAAAVFGLLAALCFGVPAFMGAAYGITTRHQDDNRGNPLASFLGQVNKQRHELYGGLFNRRPVVTETSTLTTPTPT